MGNVCSLLGAALFVTPSTALSAPHERSPIGQTSFRLPWQRSRTTLPRPVSPTPAELSSNLAAVRDRISAAERRSGRPAGSVTLIGVVKTLQAETIAAAVALGLADLGENKVQEAEQHQQQVARTAARWHMIGHLQRNKVGKALELFDVVHGVDDLNLAEALSRRAVAAGKVQPVLIEVNVSAEASKFGLAPASVTEVAERVWCLPGLALRGLMTVGAPADEVEAARPGFALLRTLRDGLVSRLGRELPELSMGMSGDFEVAIEEGATMVRVGTALFGARNAHGGV